MLAEFLTEMINKSGIDAEVFCPKFSQDIRMIPPEEVIHSNAVLSEFQDEKEKKKYFRVSESLGYMGPLDS